jgi:hypothetical protein
MRVDASATLHIRFHLYPIFTSIMGIVSYFNRPRGHQVHGGDGTITPGEPKVIEPTIISSPESSGTATPAHMLPSPAGSEDPLIFENIPHQFGRLGSWRGSLILLVTSGSQFLDNVFMTSANIALSSIQQDFKVSSTDLQWMISAYTLTFGGFLLLAGALSDRYVSLSLFLFFRKEPLFLTFTGMVGRKSSV